VIYGGQEDKKRCTYDVLEIESLDSKTARWMLEKGGLGDRGVERR
jgi:hypothetical protein